MQGDQGAATDSRVLVRDKTTGFIKKFKTLKERKYYDEHLRYGFSFTGDKDYPKPLCYVCGEILSNSSETIFIDAPFREKYPVYKQEDVNFF